MKCPIVKPDPAICMMKKTIPQNKLVDLLLSYGLTWRSINLLLVFLGVFIVVTSVFAFFSNGYLAIVWIVSLIPLVILEIIIGLVFFSSNIKDSITSKKQNSYRLESNSAGRKIYIGIASAGAFVALTIVFFCLVVVTGVQKHVELVVLFWFFVIGPICSSLLYRFFGKFLR